MTRIQYFLFSLALNIFLVLTGNNPVIALLLLPVFFYLASERFGDIGMTKWWLVGIVVPVVNLYPLFNLTFASTGYKIQDHANYNKVDGWHMLGFGLWISMVLIVLVVAAQSY